MKFKLGNETEYPTREVKAIIRWVVCYLEVEDQPVMVKVKHTNQHAYGGRFYPEADMSSILKIPSGMRYLIVLRVAKASAGRYPATYKPYKRKNGPEPWEVATWQEALVSMTAHEVFHLRQHVTGNGNHGTYNEVETEWAAYRLLQEWRKEKG